jgi:hypothetical protein
VIETFYIYLHRRADTGEVFYVGKGTARTDKKRYKRAYCVDDRNVMWRRIVSKTAYSVDVVADFFDESDAFRMERELIALHGRRMDGGTLCNFTLGGEGHSGLSPSAKTRAKLSAAFSGERHFNWGKKLSAETCRKKSETLKSSPKNLRGKKLPQWWKDRIAIGKIGKRNPMYGKTGASHPMSRKVVDRLTGATYDSVQIAAEALGHKMKTLYNWLSGHRPNPTTLEFA